MKITKKTLAKSSLLALVILLLIGGVVKYFYSTSLVKFRYEGIRGIKVAVDAYLYDNETLPPLDNWCDKLIEDADCSPLMFEGWIDREEGKCGYALNENLAGMNLNELDDKIVLAFEAKGKWNLSGGIDLAKNTKQKDVAVVFVDGYVGFVKREKLDTLKWKP